MAGSAFKPLGKEVAHLHIDNTSRLGPVFEITPTLVEDALARHPQVADCTRITMDVDGAGFAEAMSTANALFGWNFDRSGLARKAPHLRWIHLQGAGVNLLSPLDWVPPNVTLTNSRGVHGKRATEYLMMAMLALKNSLPQMMSNQHQQQWRQIHTDSIEGKTLLIFGVGSIGGAVATMAKTFGLHVLGIRRTGSPHDDVDEMHPPEALATLLPRADFVLITAPHTPATTSIIGQTEFNLIKRGAGFINYSRADLVDYAALRVALQEGRINAIVDVFPQEPLPEDSPLWQTPNMIITPHSSSNDPKHLAARSVDLLFDNLFRFINDHDLKNVIDLELQY